MLMVEPEEPFLRERERERVGLGRNSLQYTWYTLYKRRVCRRHKRRIKTEEKAKVVAYVWEGIIYSTPCRASYLPRTILKNRMN